MMIMVRCVSCDGYGWFEEDSLTEECDWCGGIGYMYRDERHVDHRIPKADYAKVASTLEQLEAERLRELGYTGSAVHPSQQAVRKKDTDDSGGDSTQSESS